MQSVNIELPEEIYQYHSARRGRDLGRGKPLSVLLSLPWVQGSATGCSWSARWPAIVPLLIERVRTNPTCVYGLRGSHIGTCVNTTDVFDDAKTGDW